MGLGIVGAYGTQSLVIVAREKFEREAMKKYLYIPLAVFALCGLASILSKHGVSSITTPLSIMANPTVMQNTSELVSVANSSFYTPYKHLLVLALFFGAAGVLVWRIRIHDVITAIYGMRLPLLIARGVAFMSILTIPLVASCADGALDKAGEYFRKRAEEKEALLRKAARTEKSGRKREKPQSKKGQADIPDAPAQPVVVLAARNMGVVVAMSLFLLIMGTGAFYQYYKLRDVMEWGIGITEHKFSFKGVEFLRGLDIRGNMFNFFDIGGFLEWQLHPRKLTFIDGRGAGWPQFPEHQIVTSGIERNRECVLEIQHNVYRDQGCRLLRNGAAAGQLPCRTRGLGTCLRGRAHVGVREKHPGKPAHHREVPDAERNPQQPHRRGVGPLHLPRREQTVSCIPVSPTSTARSTIR